MANERLRDSGGWGDYRLPQIWDMVKDEDPVPTYQQVDAWQRMAALCTDQADVLQKALDQLMVRWPPNPGSAAEVFKGHVDTMIWSMRDSAAAASANVAPLIKIVTALSQAKDEIGALVQQHAAFQGVAEDDAGPTALEPWEDTLDAQARRIMALTDHKIGEAAADIRSPTPYVAAWQPEIRERQGSGNGGDGGQSSGPPRRTVPLPTFDPPPVVPPVTPAGADTTSPILDGDRLPPMWLGEVGSERSPIGGSFVNTPVGVALAPGGVIGSPAIGVGSAESQSTGIADQNRAVRGASPMVAPPLAARGATPAKSGTGAVPSAGRRRRRSDPADPWAPPAGGPGVLEPAPEPEYFDPGPNVIGIDR